VTLRIATRRSALALAQARSVAEALGGAELVEVVTAGDRGERGGDKSRWVGELERTVLEGEADLAVHSAKDVPGELAAGLAIVAVPPRADPRDALCGAASLDDLPPGARVGTSSLRRSSQLRAVRDDLEVLALRGNVDTRLRRLAAGELDALVLAMAGLERLDRAAEAGCALDPDRFVPAPGQGSLALEARADDEAVRERVGELDDPTAHACLRAERALTARLDATCHTPVGGHAMPVGDGRLRLGAYVGLPDGSAWVRDVLEGTIDADEQLGRTVGERVLAGGGRRVLEAVA
jgi:hydroxymethylbilane synthase